MAPKPLNHNPTNLKKVPNGFPTSEYPNKCTVCTYKKHSLSKNAKYKVAFFFLRLLGNISSRILSRPWCEQVISDLKALCHPSIELLVRSSLDLTRVNIFQIRIGKGCIRLL